MFGNMDDLEVIATIGAMDPKGAMIFAFRDPATGVWYLANKYSITPRLDKNGELYTD